MAQVEKRAGSLPATFEWEYAPAPEARDIVRIRERYGLFPSEYGLLRDGRHRRGGKTLNLSLGMAILAHLRQGRDLRTTVARFYERWDRDYQADFGVRLGPFLHRNNPARILIFNGIIDHNRRAFGCISFTLIFCVKYVPELPCIKLLF
jgi:hypothetical protein